MKKVLPILLCIVFLSAASGYELFSGDTIEIELDKPYEYYSVVGNSSPVELTLQESGNFINLTVGKYVKGSFELVFFDREKQIITVYSGGGSSQTRTKYVDRNVTEYVDRTFYVNQPNKTETEPIILTPKDKESNWLIKVMLTLAIFLTLIFLIYLIFYARSNERGD